ncbi:BatD family protein [Hydrogenimonas urashimensis]|uniref:BatD family protein n=1 Tax=Hydrogenimonas urashimensis TaxID=2740515 RepID=UPI00191655C4|nr:BatD family protein [Hydrogenimonas urashimensis]
MNPGRIFLLLLLFLPLMGKVVISVDENPVIAGESVEVMIEAEGENVRFPEIQKIGNDRVVSEGMQRLERLEGNRTVVKWVKVLAFTPQKSVTIPPLEVEVDGRIEKTQPLRVRVKPKSKSDVDNFIIELMADRNASYVGETVDVTVRFREKRDVPVMNVDFVPIQYENFWVKRVGKERRYAQGNYLVHEIHYLFFPQKVGDLTIGPAEVKVAMTKKMRDAFGFIVRRPQWITVRSRSLTLHVEPLPEGVTLVGRFRIKAEVSTTQTKKGRPVELTVRVDAEGNIEDFEMPRLQIDGVTVYEEEPKIEQKYRYGSYSGSWEKKYILIGEKSFTIPPFEIDYFDPKTEEIRTAKTKPISIEVAGSVEKERAKRPKKSSVFSREEKRMQWIYMTWIVAFLLGMGVMYLWMDSKRKRGGTYPGSRVQTDSDSRMLQRLMPYISESKEAAQMAENLYASMFEGQSVKIDRREFAKLMERLKKARNRKQADG